MYNDNDLTITMIGLVLIFLALAAYLRVLSVSLALERTGETQAIWKYTFHEHNNHFEYFTYLMSFIITISVTPFPAKLSANSLVSWLSLYGMWPLFFFPSLSEAMQYPV